MYVNLSALNLKNIQTRLSKTRLGSIFGVKRGDENGPTGYGSRYMDEVGFMVTSINKKGLFVFNRY